MSVPWARGLLSPAAVAGLMCTGCRVPPVQPEPVLVSEAPRLPPTESAAVDLAAAQFAFVDLGAGAGELGRLAGRKGTWLLWAMVEPDYDHDAEVWRVQPSIQPKAPGATTAVVPRSAVARIPDLPPPPTHVWLIGPDGPCKVTLPDEAQADFYLEGLPTVEIAFALAGCPGTDWAPVAVHGVAPPPDLRWRAAMRVFAAKQQPPEPEPSQHPLIRTAVEFITPQRDERLEGRSADAHVVEVPATTPRLAGMFAGVDPAPTGDDDDEDSCETGSWQTLAGIVTGERFAPLPRPKSEIIDRYVDADLLGGFAVGEAPLAAVLRDGLGLVVFIPDADEGWKKGRWIELGTGGYHDEDAAAQEHKYGSTCDP